MKAADEPAYLTVGTDVSAKYRGAFCEAKIKTVKRMVKVKVTLKGESTSQVVQDDQVKGPLRVGSTVEVKTNEGLSSEAVISKLTDASLYTVVFDDGDEKTLRRTSLCLKGERHFAESETLDQLPLTNPEHFGTPVIGKKSNRGGRRSSQAVADEENESSSSEDEEDDRRRLNDELLGKVCSIESEEEPSNWYLALVVSPSCNDELMVKKDQCLVRSFRFESAQMFLKNREVPDVWKMDMSQIMDSSSSDDEDDEEKESDEEEEEEGEEEEEEADPEERDNFLQQLYKFMEDRGTSINKPPVLGYKDLNLFKLFRLVYHLGGCHKIESGTVWKQVYMDLGIPVLNSAASYNVKTAYKKYLYGFEEYCRSASITFRTIHHNNPRPPAATPANQKTAAEELKESSQVKAESVNEKREEAESESESEKEEVMERQMSPRGRRRCVGSQGKADRESSSRPDKRGGGENSEEPREVRRRSNRRVDDSEKDRDTDEEDGDSLTGTKVRVKYGRGKTQKIYEAHIKKTDVDNGEQFYLVHYYGWNVRYDEWVKADRIIWPVEKGSKKRQRRKLKNKDKDEVEKEQDKDEDKPPVKPTAGKRGRPQIRTTPTSLAGRSVSKTPSNEGRSNGKNSRTDMTSNMSNGDKDSGNSTDDSESEDPPDKKQSPLRERPEAPPCQKEEEDEQQEVKEEETSEVADVTAPHNDNTQEAKEENVSANLRETGSETPPRTPLCTLTPTLAAASPSQTTSPPHSVLKRQDEPMVVLRCLPTQHLPLESPTADSDTDSATEDEEDGGEMEELPEDRSSVALKRKAAEQKAADKKFCPDMRQEETASPKTSAATPKVAATRRSEGVPKAEEMQVEVSEEHLKGGAMKELEVHARTPPPNQDAPGPSPAEELEPQIGPEALVCHEVDLDDPDEKEKPTSSSEHLLLVMREQQQPQVRPFLPAATPNSTPCTEELHPVRSTAEEEGRPVRQEQEGDSSPGFDGSASSSSNSLLSLQENKDRGQKRAMDCNSSPSSKKQKRNQKRPNTPGKVEKNGAGHSSDSEDQSRLLSLSKSQKTRCPGLSSPPSHSKDKQNFPSPQRTYKWTFQLDELDSMSSTERISFLQAKLQEIRKYYMSLKSEVASIDRRRKRLKKKEREGTSSSIPCRADLFLFSWRWIQF
uniref:ARID domain-containing protein n=1 Tax=Anabas testudineus TaxID=64144 RepID=A0A7N6A0P0_ANATE